MTATTLWIIYLVTLVVSFIALYFLLNTHCQKNLHKVCFLTALIGAIVVFISLLWVDFLKLNESDKTSITVLIAIAFILPVFVIIYLIWNCKLLCEN